MSSLFLYFTLQMSQTYKLKIMPDSTLTKLIFLARKSTTWGKIHDILFKLMTLTVLWFVIKMLKPYICVCIFFLYILNMSSNCILAFVLVSFFVGSIYIVCNILYFNFGYIALSLHFPCHGYFNWVVRFIWFIPDP